MQKNRTKRSIRRTAVLLGTVIIAGTVMFAVPSSGIQAASSSSLTDATVQAYEAQIAKIQQEQADLAAKIQAAKNSQASAAETKTYLDKQVSLTLDKIDTTEALLTELAGKIAVKQSDIAGKQSDIEKQYATLRERLRISYEEDTASQIDMILGSGDLVSFLSSVEKLGSFIDYDMRLMSEYRQSKLDLETALSELEAAEAKQSEYMSSLETDRADLEKQQAENSAYIANLKLSESQYQSLYTKYIAEEEKLNDELQEYIKELQAKLNAQYVGGTFGWPVDTKYNYISSSYGWRTYWYYGTKVTDFHRGIDIVGANSSINGAPVYAANDGTVIIKTTHYSYGNYIMIDHGGGRSTLYAHMSKFASGITVDSVVKKGDIIGYVGTTGNSTGPHLHFEVRINGATVDPLDGYVVVP